MQKSTLIPCIIYDCRWISSISRSNCSIPYRISDYPFIGAFTMSQVTIGNQQNAEMFNYLFNNQNNPMPLEFLRLFNGYREYAKAREMFELWNMWKYLENNPSAHPRDLRQVIGK